MKQMALYVCLLSMFWISGCERPVGENKPVVKELEHGFTEQDKLQMVEDLMQTWSPTYDQGILKQAIDEQIRRWNNEKETILFSIIDVQLPQNEFVGIFQSAKNWELKGRNQANEAFIVESEAGQLFLTYNQHSTAFVEGELDFLLPIQHIQVVQHILSEMKYDYVSWNKVGEDWMVDLRASFQSMEHYFANYLAQHFQEEERVKYESEYEINGFSILYRLQLDQVNETWRVESLSFILLKDEETLDHLQFRF